MRAVQHHPPRVSVATCDHQSVTDDETRAGGATGDAGGLAPMARNTTEQIFVVSAAMVGVCLTLMGIVGIITSLSQVETLADELLAGDAMVFLIACLSSYFALRTSSKASNRYARAADVTFISALIAIVAIGAIVALHLV
jgi:hypothetical protein